MERFLELAFRRGVIPWCCGGASVCFAFYGVKVTRSARSWEALAAVLSAQSSRNLRVDGDQGGGSSSLSTRLQIVAAQREGGALYQHAGTCAALAMTSAAITWQATTDWTRYRKLKSLELMEQWLLRQRQLFFLRPSVLGTAILSFGAVRYRFGGVRMFYLPNYNTQF